MSVWAHWKKEQLYLCLQGMTENYRQINDTLRTPVWLPAQLRIQSILQKSCQSKEGSLVLTLPPPYWLPEKLSFPESVVFDTFIQRVRSLAAVYNVIFGPMKERWPFNRFWRILNKLAIDSNVCWCVNTTGHTWPMAITVITSVLAYQVSVQVSCWEGIDLEVTTFGIC